MSENKPNTKLVLLCLEFNKAHKQNVYHINLFKTFNTSKLFSSQGCSDEQGLWILQFNNPTFVVSFHSMRIKPFKSSLTVAWFSGPITNEIASFCTDKILCKMAFFMFAKVGKVMMKDFETKKLLVVCFFIISNHTCTLIIKFIIYLQVFWITNREKKEVYCQYVCLDDHFF